MTFDPTSVEVTCVTVPKDHYVQVPWEYVNVCGYSYQFCKNYHIHTYTHILRTYYVHTTYILHTTYRISDHIVSQARQQKLSLHKADKYFFLKIANMKGQTVPCDIFIMLELEPTARHYNQSVQKADFHFVLAEVALKASTSLSFKIQYQMPLVCFRIHQALMYSWEYKVQPGVVYQRSILLPVRWSRLHFQEDSLLSKLRCLRD